MRKITNEAGESRARGGLTMVLNISDLRKYLILLWIIISSGVWSISVSASVTVLLHFSIASFMLLIMFQKGIIRNAVVLVLFLVFLILALLFNSDYSAWMSYAFIFCFCIIGLYVSLLWKKGEFLDKYVNIMLVIAVISLVMYFMRGFLGTHQAGFPVVQGQSVSYTNFYFYLYCRELPDRNCAVFWEPGAYAVFLGIALYHTLITNSNKKVLKSIIIIVALFTTQSTLAYTLILFALLLYMLKRNDDMGLLQKLFLGIVAIVIILFAMNEFGVFQNIQEKLFSGLQTNASSRARNVAQLIDLKIISSAPFFGVGFGDYQNHVNSIGALFGQNWTMAANTFTFMGAIFGIPYVILSGIGLIKICPRNISSLFRLVSIAFWIWLFITQNFVQKPIFYCLVFLGYTLRAFAELEEKMDER